MNKLSDGGGLAQPVPNGGAQKGQPESADAPDAEAQAVTDRSRSLERMVRRLGLSAETLTELDETLRLSRAEADLCYTGHHPHAPAHENCIGAIVMARRKLGLECDEDSLVRSHERALEIVNKGRIPA